MDEIDSLIHEYERKSVTGFGSSELILWVRRAYKALKKCKTEVMQ